MREWVLPDDLTAAAVARGHVAEALDAIAVVGEAQEDAILIASELAANAARYGAAPLTIRLETMSRRLRITVGNHGESPDPQIRVAEPHAAHGRGLAMIKGLAEDVGWDREADRLEVWADVALP
jgi:anti-sigma regulatory factor (Ser/Thr protein kinase)